MNNSSFCIMISRCNKYGVNCLFHFLGSTWQAGSFGMEEIRLNKCLCSMATIIEKREDRTITLEEMCIEMTKAPNEISTPFYLLAEISGNANFHPSGAITFPPDIAKAIYKRQKWTSYVWNIISQCFWMASAVFFGVGLLLSIFLVAMAILVILVLIMMKKGGNRSSSPSSSSNTPFFGGGGGGNGWNLSTRGAGVLVRITLREFLWFSMMREPIPIYSRRSNPIHPDDDFEPNPPNPPPHPPHAADEDENEGSRNIASSFFHDIFRFLFGDSFDTKTDHTFRTLKALGYLIKYKPAGPMITAHEAKPYVDGYIFHHDQYQAEKRKNNDHNSTLEDESYMLPLLRCFNGKMEASEDGQHLFYIFPDLAEFECSVQDCIVKHQYSVGNRKVRRMHGEKEVKMNFHPHDTIQDLIEEGLVPASPMLEYPLTFFYTDQSVALVVWNFVQLIILGFLLFFVDIDLLIEANQLNVSMVYSFLSVMKLLYWYLFVYAALFLIFPCCRYVFIHFANKKVQQRNATRIRVAKELHAATTFPLNK